MRDITKAPVLTRLRDDEGMGLIVVIGISAVLAILMAVASATAIRSLRSSTTHNNFESALAAAEAGIDRELSRIQLAQNGSPPTSYSSPAPCTVATPAASVFSTAESERQWAKASLLSLPASCLRSNGQGQYVAFKAPGRRTVYSMGWSPSQAHPDAKMRYLKADYVFAPFRPRQAVLTGGTTNFSGSVTLNSTTGQAASIHSNSNITGVNNSLTTTGSLTATGSVSSCSTGVQGGCASTQPMETVPQANPRAVYYYYNNTTDPVPQNWYDLCPDGTIRSPAATGPCTGLSLASAPFMNWSFVPGSSTTPGLWTLDNVRSGSVYPGTFYVLGADVRLGDRGNTSTTQNVSVLVESAPSPPAGYTNATTCNKYGGNLEWKLFNLQNNLRGVIFVVQGSLTGTANSTAKSGLMLAGDRINLQTSSASITGSLIANNTCAAAGSNNIQGVTVTYDQNVEAPVYSVVTITTWLELVG